jgi:O-antigen/teichoic acid export membrane protein
VRRVKDRAAEIVRRLLPQGRFARSVGVLAGGTALGQGLAVLASPFLTRIYTPEDFGALTVFTSVLGIIAIVAGFRYPLAIPLAKDDETAANVLVLSLVLVVALALLLGVAVLLGAGDLLRFANTPELVSFAWLLPVGTLTIGTYQAFTYWAVRRKAFKRIARTKVSQGVAGVAVQLGLGLFTNGPFGLLLGQVTGQAAGTSTLAALLSPEDRRSIRSTSVRGLRAAASRFRDFPLISTGSALLNNGGLRLPPLLVAAFFGSAVAGLYGLAVRVVSTPITLVGQSIAQVYYGELSEMLETDPTRMPRLFARVARRLFLVGVGPALVLGVAGPWLFSLVFGAEWREAGIIAQVSAVMFLAQLVVQPLSQTFIILERQELQLRWDTLRLVAVVASLAIAGAAGWDAIPAIVLLNVSLTLAYLLLLWWMYRVLRARSTGGTERVGETSAP